MSSVVPHSKQVLIWSYFGLNSGAIANLCLTGPLDTSPWPNPTGLPGAGLRNCGLPQ